MCLIGSSWNSSLGQSSSWITLEPIWWCFWPKGNLRPILWSHGSLWGPQISQNKLTTALFLRTPEKKHTVLCNILFLWMFLFIILIKRRLYLSTLQCPPWRPWGGPWWSQRSHPPPWAPWAPALPWSPWVLSPPRGLFPPLAPAYIYRTGPWCRRRHCRPRLSGCNCQDPPRWCQPQSLPRPGLLLQGARGNLGVLVDQAGRGGPQVPGLRLHQVYYIQTGLG